MKIVAISDLHGHLPELPKCDVVCICGDIVPLNIQTKFLPSLKWLIKEFRDWTDNLECEKVILIGGNHDFVLQNIPLKLGVPPYAIDFSLWSEGDNDSKVIYLQDQEAEVQGKIFYGTPWCPNLRNWAFYKNSKNLKEAFSQIPDTHIDVLLTHCPPMIGTQGQVLQSDNWNFNKNFGCEELAEVLKTKNVDWVLSGHIHSGNHEVENFNNTKLVNVSMKNENYEVSYKPFIFEI